MSAWVRAWRWYGSTCEVCLLNIDAETWRLEIQVPGSSARLHSRHPGCHAAKQAAEAREKEKADG